MPKSSIATLLYIMTISLLLASCGKSYVDFEPDNQVRTSKPVPSGQGGHVKTGKPYQIAGQWYYPLATADGYNKTGIASWYGKKFHGKKTANGERYDMHAMSAAHKTLPMPSMVRVTNLDNGKSVVVRVNDRGPFVKSRIIDLSFAAAKALGYANKGTAHVRVQTLTASSQATQPTKTPQHTASKPQQNAISYGNGSIYVQLGAFSSRTNATQLRENLSSDFPNIHIQHIEQTHLYRVRIGPYQTPPETENIVLSLQQLGYNNAIVVIE